MTIFTSVIGLGTIVLSLLGLLLCLAGIVGVGMVTRRVEAVRKAAFAAADEAFAFVDATLVRVKGLLENSRQRVTEISQAVERLSDEQADAGRESEPLLQSLDAVFRELKSAEPWLDSSYAVAKGISRVVEAAMSSRYAASLEDSVGVAITKRGQEVAQSVTEVVGKLQVVRQELVELRDKGRLVHEVVVRGMPWVAELQGKFANLATGLDSFCAKVTQTKACYTELGLRIHAWIRIAAVVLAILLVWFGISQVSMAGHGWRLMQDKRATETTR